MKVVTDSQSQETQVGMDIACEGCKSLLRLEASDIYPEIGLNVDCVVCGKKNMLYLSDIPGDWLVERFGWY